VNWLKQKSATGYLRRATKPNLRRQDVQTIELLCAECEAHLAYGENRRAFCPKDPKPFCANCDVHCYRSEEREWQRQMMRYSGRRSMFRGHAIDGIKHLMETKRHKREAEKLSARQATDPTAAGGAGANRSPHD